MAVKSLSGILKKTSEISGKQEKIDFLRANMNRPLAIIIQNTYTDIEWDLPEGAPPYEPSEFDEPANLYKEVKRFYLFIKGQSPENLHKIKRERLFIELLEFIDAEDAKLVLGMKDGKLPYPRLTKNFMQEALPEIF